MKVAFKIWDEETAEKLRDRVNISLYASYACFAYAELHQLDVPSLYVFWHNGATLYQTSPSVRPDDATFPEGWTVIISDLEIKDESDVEKANLLIKVGLLSAKWARQSAIEAIRKLEPI